MTKLFVLHSTGLGFVTNIEKSFKRQPTFGNAMFIGSWGSIEETYKNLVIKTKYGVKIEIPCRSVPCLDGQDVIFGVRIIRFKRADDYVVSVEMKDEAKKKVAKVAAKK